MKSDSQLTTAEIDSIFTGEEVSDWLPQTKWTALNTGMQAIEQTQQAALRSWFSSLNV